MRVNLIRFYPFIRLIRVRFLPDQLDWLCMPRIAIPLPTSNDLAYNRLNWPAYADAVRDAGGEPVEIGLDRSPRAIAELANSCQAVLLPGSPADVNPSKYGHPRDEATAPADLPRENVDELLLQDAHNLYKPILGICFGVQILNTWRSGTLIQDLTVMPVNHSASRSVLVAHSVAIPMDTLLATLVDRAEAVDQDGFLRLPVNSSHHQAVGIPGDNLRVSARCPQDGVIEAIEGPQHSDAWHFVLGVQWHPERTTACSPTSRGIFSRFVQEASIWSPRAVTISVG
jgi:putative glutamine amidotransferase